MRIWISSVFEEQAFGYFANHGTKNLNSPLASSAGRLFDAVAAAVGICRESVSFEGQAAIELEALAAAHYQQADHGYGFEFKDGSLNWSPMWTALLNDLKDGTTPGVIAARFHKGLALAVAETAIQISHQREIQTVILTGGVFQNRLLLELTSCLLREQGLNVLSPALTPANDGGLSLGQAVIALGIMRQ